MSASAVGGIDRIEHARAVRERRVASATGDDHRAAHLRNPEQQFRKFQRQMDTAVAFGIAGQTAGMERNTVPCEPLLIRHRCIVVLGRMMSRVFLQNDENAGGRFVAGLSS